MTEEGEGPGILKCMRCREYVRVVPSFSEEGGVIRLDGLACECFVRHPPGELPMEEIWDSHFPDEWRAVYGMEAP